MTQGDRGRPCATWSARLEVMRARHGDRAIAVEHRSGCGTLATMRRFPALWLVLVAACGGGGGSEVTPTSDAPADSTPIPEDVVCTGAQAGAYCGGDQVDHGDPSVLYDCPGPGQPPTSAMACSDGCVVEDPGVADHCRVPVSDGEYRLPWQPGVTMRLTQDCNDSCCADHVGTDAYAYDWANGGAFTIVAARGGTISHLKINSTSGCGSSACVNQANYLVIDHGDGTQSTYLHLEGGSLAPGIACGATVSRGQPLARAGTTGWSTGIHLHFQVSGVHDGAATCECGADGNACNPNTVTWSNFWVSASYPSTAIAFAEWPDAGACADRRMQMPASQNE